MFGRRKRQEEEQLVPHGLIWQATETRATPQEPGQSSPPAFDKKPVRMPARESAPTQMKSESPPGLRQLGAISPPLPWPPPKVEEIPEQPHSTPDTVAAIIEQKAPPPRIEQLITFPGPATLPERKREPMAVRFRVRALAEASSGKQALLGALARLRKGGRSSLENAGRSLGELKARVAGSYRVPVSAMGRISRALPIKQLQALPRRSAQYLDQIISRSYLAWKSRRTAWEPIVVERTRSWSRGFLQSISKAGRHRIQVRIRLVHPWSRLLRGASLRMESWGGKLRPSGAASRLWMSMTMGAASALLTLGLISVVRPYAPSSGGASASAHSASDPKTVNSPSGLLPEQKPVGRAPGSPASGKGKQQSRAVRAAERTPRPVPGNIEHSKPRARRSEDDDYVATDTYTYYGPSGKRTH